MPSAELAAFGRFCARHVTTESGARFVIEPWQRDVLADYFGDATETALVVPKKNGKSTLSAALALYELLSVSDAEVALAASSRDQAGVIFRQASGMVRRSPFLTKHVRPTMRELRCRRDGGVLRVLAADANTADGWIGTSAIVDELHRHASIELYGLLRDGIRPRGGRVLTISTAGDDEESPLGKIRQAARKMTVVERGTCYLRTRSASGAFAYHEYALPPDGDRDDLELVKAANPASWHTLETLEAERASPTMTPWHWARFRCGLWERGGNAAIRPQDWDALADEATVIPVGSAIWLGLDVGWTHDTTAIVPVWPDPDGRLVVAAPVILEPPGDGSMLDESEIVAALLRFRDAYRVLGVVFDPHAGAQQLSQRLERDGLVFVEHSQHSGPMALAAARTMEHIRTGRLVHDGDRTLRAHVLNAVAKQLPGERWKFDRPRGPRVPIDGLTALAMAVSVAADPPKRSGVVHIY